jgi:hypothetical protein
MDKIIILKAGQKSTKNQLKKARQEYTEAAKLSINYTADCPPSMPKALAEFAVMARELRKNNRKIKPALIFDT